MTVKKRNHNRVSVSFENDVINSYKKLKNLRKVGDLYGKYPTAISRILKRNGIKIKPNKSGKNHPGWKGGVISKGNGYIGVWNQKHQRADKQGYVYQHTLVWEKETGSLPKKGENIHHIDLDKTNNNFDNLYLCSHTKHAKIHRSLDALLKPLIEKGVLSFDKEIGDYKLNF